MREISGIVYDSDDVRSLVRKDMDMNYDGSIRRYAKDHCISATFISDFLNGKHKATTRLAGIYGLKREVFFVVEKGE